MHKMILSKNMVGGMKTLNVHRDEDDKSDFFFEIDDHYHRMILTQEEILELVIEYRLRNYESYVKPFPDKASYPAMIESVSQKIKTDDGKIVPLTELCYNIFDEVEKNGGELKGMQIFMNEYDAKNNYIIGKGIEIAGVPINITNKVPSGKIFIMKPANEE